MFIRCLGASAAAVGRGWGEGNDRASTDGLHRPPQAITEKLRVRNVSSSTKKSLRLLPNRALGSCVISPSMASQWERAAEFTNRKGRAEAPAPQPRAPTAQWGLIDPSIDWLIAWNPLASTPVTPPPPPPRRGPPALQGVVGFVSTRPRCHLLHPLFLPLFCGA